MEIAAISERGSFGRLLSQFRGHSVTYLALLDMRDGLSKLKARDWKELLHIPREFYSVVSISRISGI